ncbi:MAG: hypothetical protein ACRD01_11410 [Terriglobales bacterium]
MQSRVFQPTPAQRRFLTLIQQSPQPATLTELCRQAGVDRSGYYKWCRDASFCAWLMQAWSGAVLLDGWQVVNVARARMGESLPHLRAMINLLFDPRGLAALDAWQQRVRTLSVESDLPAAQALAAPDSTKSQSSTRECTPSRRRHSGLAPAPLPPPRRLTPTPPNPARAMRHLGRLLAPLAARPCGRANLATLPGTTRLPRRQPAACAAAVDVQPACQPRRAALGPVPTNVAFSLDRRGKIL